MVEQISAATDGSVVHVEVFRDGRVGTSILGRPRPLPPHRRATRPRDMPYTLIYEEPSKMDLTLLASQASTGHDTVTTDGSGHSLFDDVRPDRLGADESRRHTIGHAGGYAATRGHVHVRVLHPGGRLGPAAFPPQRCPPRGRSWGTALGVRAPTGPRRGDTAPSGQLPPCPGRRNAFRRGRGRHDLDRHGGRSMVDGLREHPASLSSPPGEAAEDARRPVGRWRRATPVLRTVHACERPLQLCSPAPYLSPTLVASPGAALKREDTSPGNRASRSSARRWT
ncbi:Uncharacterised protein [Kytococcus sedentarius]|nr:Uncharacterised protein [Kytococcus sedentarius]